MIAEPSRSDGSGGDESPVDAQRPPDAGGSPAKAWSGRDVTATQRWRDGRGLLVRRGEGFEAGRHGAEPVDDRVARAFVRRHHYSGSFPASILNVALLAAGRRDPVGILTFSVPVQPRAAASYGAGDVGFCDLGRLVILDEVPFNAETWLVARALALLAATKRDAGGAPRHKVVLAYSDPVARVDASGRVVLPGHVGHVYGPAGSAVYLGRATPRTLWLAADGTAMSPRSLSKIRRGERGDAAAYRALVAKGAPPIRPGEGAAPYVARALSEGPFSRVRHPGNHVYAFPAGSAAERRRTRAAMDRGLPYPGRDLAALT